MNLSSDVAFSFQSDAAGQGIFRVLQFNGEEKLGDLYRFDIQLVTHSEQVDPAKMLDSKCGLLIDCYGKKREFSGILSEFSFLKSTENGFLYQATLVPKLWLLTQFTTNEVYLGLNLSETLTQLFDEAGITADEYDLSQISNYRNWEYRCQFGENHYNFLKRITEREGVYFFFEQKDQQEKAVFCNKNNQHPSDILQTTYSPITSTSYATGTPVIYQWTEHNQRVPKEVIVKDYNNDQPSVDLSAKAQIDAKGLGEVFRYCDNLLDLEEAKSIADIRAEEIASGKTQFFGASLDVSFAAGYPVQITSHPLSKLNIEYIPILVSHSGFAPDMAQIHTQEEQPYKNTIQAIASSVQFRPSATTEKPRFYGVLNAIIDSEGDGQYAQLDSRGRYKVKLPFDRRARDGAQASWWFPMSQTNAGSNSGMHFPLLKGTEVLLSFIGGDPDRPIITGAVPNAAQPSVVREDNHTKNKIKTAANNLIELEDEAGSERIKLFSPNSNSYFHLGAANPVNANGIMLMTEGGFYQEVVSGSQITLTTNKKLDDDGNPIPVTTSLLDSADVAEDLIDEAEIDDSLFMQADENSGKLGDKIPNERTGEYHFLRRTGEQYTWTDGNTYTFGGSKDFNYGNGYEVSYVEFDGRTKWDGSFELDYFSIPGYDPDKLLIGKTIGDTYEYQAGNKEEVYFGLDEVSRGATLATTEVKATGVNTSASISALNFNFEAGLKFDLTVAAAVDLSFGPKFERSEADVGLTGVQGVKVMSANEVALHVTPLVAPPAAPTATWAKAVVGAAETLTKLGLMDAAVRPENSAGSVVLSTTDVKMSYAGPLNQISINAAGTKINTTKISITTAASATISAAAAINIRGSAVSVSGTTALNCKAPTLTLRGATATSVQGSAVSVKANAALSLQGATINMKANAMGQVNAGGMLKVSASGMVQIG